MQLLAGFRLTRGTVKAFGEHEVSPNVKPLLQYTAAESNHDAASSWAGIW